MPLMLLDGDPDFRLTYCWTEEAMRRGIYLHPFHNMFICAALTEDDMTRTLEATDAAFAALKSRAGTLGPVPQLAGRFPPESS